MSGLTIVTGADWQYARCAEQFLLSARRHGLARAHRWLVYDLGMHAAQSERLARRFPWVELRRFDFSAYPEHFSIEAQCYGWKPAIIREVALETRGRVVWFDSATLLHGDLRVLEEKLERTGIYLLRGAAQAGQRTDRRTTARLQTPPELLDARECVAGVVGFDMRRPGIAAFVESWYALALRAELIRPRVPRYKSHMPEQSLLTYLAITATGRGELELGDEEIDISSAHPVRWMSSRNKVPPGLPLWADPWARAWYWLYKSADRWWHRLVELDKRHLDGWKRALREEFAVYVGVRGQASMRRIPCDWNAYYADPFLCEHQGRPYLLMERFDYRRNLGRIVALPLDGDLGAAAPVPVELPPGHLSFPYVLEHEGRWLLVPESSERGVVDLYAFEEFPASVRRVRRLLYGVNAADSVLFRHRGRYWLVTSIDTDEVRNRYLAIYSTADLIHGEFVAHPVNQRRLYADRRFGYGRAAGRWHFSGGAILRPIQANEDYYGQKLAWMRITRFDEDFFEEEPGDPPDAADLPQGVPGMRHVDALGALRVYDRRERTNRWQGLRWLLRMPWRR